MRRHARASRKDVGQNRGRASVFVRRLCATSLCYVCCVTSLVSQRPQPFDQQLRDNQQRLEGIRRERSEVEQELERLRTQAHSLSDELANIERQKETTNRIVNELDRQIAGLSDQIDRTTVDLLLAQNALAEKRAVLERRLVDIYKRGALYAYQVLLAAESFGDLLSRYKYLYLVSRQDRLLANDMSKLQRRIEGERKTLVDARDALARRKTERTDELDRYLGIERERQASLRATRRSARQALERLSELERGEKSLNDRIAALERARLEAEARGAAAAARSRRLTWVSSTGPSTDGSCTGSAPRRARTRRAFRGTASASRRPSGRRCGPWPPAPSAWPARWARTSTRC